MHNLYDSPSHQEMIAGLKDELKKVRAELDETDEKYPHIQKVIDQHWDANQ